MRIAALEHDRDGTATTMHLLAHIGRSVPDDVWLTLLNGENDAITIEGLSLSHGAVAEFLTNLEGGGRFGRPVDLTRSNLQPGGSGPDHGRDLIEFAIRARLVNADDAGEPAVTDRTVAVNGGVRR
jgi:hypothetical protein